MQENTESILIYLAMKQAALIATSSLFLACATTAVYAIEFGTEVDVQPSFTLYIPKITRPFRLVTSATSSTPIPRNSASTAP